MTVIEKWQPGPHAGVAGDPASLGEVFSASREQQVSVDNIMSRWAMLDRAYANRADLVHQLTGQRLVLPGLGSDPVADRFMSAGAGERAGIDRRQAEGHAEYFKYMLGIGREDPYDRFDRELRDLATRFPQHVEALQPDLSPRRDAEAMARRASQRGEDVSTRRGRDQNFSTFTDPVGTLAEFSGALVGSFEDPATAFVNIAGGAEGKIAKSLAWNAARQGAVNAGAQASMEPFVQQWRRDAGLPHGLDQAAQNVVLAGVVGGAIDVSFRGAARAGNLARGAPEAQQQGGIFRDRAPDQPPPAPAATLDEAARARPAEDPLRRAAEGEPAALRDVATRVGASEDPAVRGALDGLDAETALPVVPPQLRAIIDAQGLDDGEHLSALAQAIRREINPAEPPPPRVDGARAARSEPLADGEMVPKAGREIRIDDKPVSLDRVQAQDLGVDAATFQFKGSGDARGVTDRLSGVTRWDPAASGRVLVFEKRTGEQIVADGHQRAGLARRLERDGHPAIELDAIVFREADGWTPADVRALAAKKNLQEGSGTVLDAAKVLRERPDIIDASVPLGSQKMRDARALARLSDDAFRAVVGGVVEPNHAALVGSMVADPARHAAMIDGLAAARPDNLQQARLAIGQLMQAPTSVETQLTLLGAETATRSLLPEKVKVLDKLLGTLSRDKRLFSALVDNEGRIADAGNQLATDANARAAADAAMVREIVERLSVQAGPVADMLNAAAERVARGEPIKAAAEDVAAQIRATLDRGGLSALIERDAGRPPPSVAFDDPLGAAAKDQADHLQRARDEAAQADQVAQDDLLFSLRQPRDVDQLASLEARLALVKQKAADLRSSLPREALDFLSQYGPRPDGAKQRADWLIEKHYIAEEQKVLARNFLSVLPIIRELFYTTAERHDLIDKIGFAQDMKKVRDAATRPRPTDPEIKVYHGTHENFTKYDGNEARKRSEAARDAKIDIMFVTPNREFASKFGGPIELNLSEGYYFDPNNMVDLSRMAHFIDAKPNAEVVWKRLLKMDGNNWGLLEDADMVAELQRIGYDGVRMREEFYNEKDQKKEAATLGIFTKGKVSSEAVPGEPSVMFSLRQPRDVDQIGYYSQALEAAKGLKQAKGTPEQMLAQLKAAGVKDAEIEATNLSEFLAGKKSVTRDEIVDHLQVRRVPLKEKVYGIDSKASAVAKFINKRMEEWRRNKENRALFELGTDRDNDNLFYSDKPLRRTVKWLESKGVVLDEDAVFDDPARAFERAGVTIESGSIDVLRDSDGFFYIIGNPNDAEVFLVSELGDTTDNYANKNDAILSLESDAKYLINDTSLAEEEHDVRREFAMEAELKFGIKDDTKYSMYSLDPSNPTYRETALHIPQGSASLSLSDYIKEYRMDSHPYYITDAEIEEFWKKGMLLRRDRQPLFGMSHIPLHNVVAHTMTSITKHDGRPVYTIDQIQSDWGQKVREEGTRDEARIADLRRQQEHVFEKIDKVTKETSASPEYGEYISQAQKLLKKYHPENAVPSDIDELADRIRMLQFEEDIIRKRLSGVFKRASDKEVSSVINNSVTLYDNLKMRYTKGELQTLHRERDRLAAEYRLAEAKGQGHPLVNTTEQWVNTMLRSVIRHAIDAGADYIAIPHGDTVLSYNPGGESGMRGFYGSRTSEGIVPKNLRKLLEKIDKASPRPSKIETLETPSGRRGYRDDTSYDFDRDQTGFTLFPLTEKIRRSVVEDGQPLFKVRDADGQLTPQAADALRDPRVMDIAQALVEGELRGMAHLFPADVRVSLLEPGGIGDTIDGAYRAKDARMFIAMGALDKGATVRHELVHAYRSLGLLSDGEYGALKSKATEVLTPEQAARIEQQYGEAYEGKKLSPEALADRIEEEKVAFLVEERWRRGRSFGDILDPIIDRIIELIERVQNALAGHGFHSFEDVMARIESGEVARRSPGEPGRGDVALSIRRDDIPESERVRAELFRQQRQRDFDRIVEIDAEMGKLYGIHGKAYDKTPQFKALSDEMVKLTDMEIPPDWERPFGRLTPAEIARRTQVDDAEIIPDRTEAELARAKAEGDASGLVEACKPR